MQADNWLPVPCVQGRHAHHNRYVARTKSTCERVQEQSVRRTRSIQFYARECRANQSKKPDPPSELGCQVSLPCNQVVWVSPLCKVRQASRLPNLGSHVCFLAGPQQPVHASSRTRCTRTHCQWQFFLLCPCLCHFATATVVRRMRASQRATGVVGLSHLLHAQISRTNSR